MLKLTALTLEGYKSFAAPFSSDNLPGLPGEGKMTNRLAFGDVTVLIGPNGAGKSNIVSFFQMLSAIVEDSFDDYVDRTGRADSILHYGSKKTPAMRVLFEFEDPATGAIPKYEFSLNAAYGDKLSFREERVTGFPPEPDLAAHDDLSALMAKYVVRNRKTSLSTKVIDILARYHSYHFHDTSDAAKIRKSCYLEDSFPLRSDAGNLVAFLFGLKNRTDTEAYYRRIENTVQLAFPQLKRFVLEPRFTNEKHILLNWLSRADDGYLMGPEQLSDGALRFAALTALLLQPPGMLPALIVLDEPELGLHPQAIELLAGMIKGVIHHQTQVLVATQSTQLVRHFDLGQIRPIEHHGGRSVILELDPEAYSEWLEEYSTGELWEKNIIGGAPTHG